MNQAVVVVVGVGAERLITLQDDHRRTVGVELVEHLADTFTGLQRRRVLGAQRHIVRFGNGLQLRHEDIRQHRQAQPEQRNEHRVAPDEVGNSLRAHPDLSRQYVYAFRVFTDLSSLTTSSIFIRQPIESLLPWAATLTKTAGWVVVVS